VLDRESSERARRRAEIRLRYAGQISLELSVIPAAARGAMSPRRPTCRRGQVHRLVRPLKAVIHIGSLPIDHQVLPQKGELVPNDLRAHVGAVEVEVSAGIGLELTTRRVIR
jgi:hypothetical protein